MKKYIFFFLLMCSLSNAYSQYGLSQKQIDSLVYTADNETRNENYLHALTIYDKLIPYYDNTSETYFLRGFCKYRLKMYANAVADFTHVVEDTSINLCNDFLIHTRATMFEGKYIKLSEVSYEHPYVDAFYYRALCKSHLSDFESAITDYNKYIACNPKDGVGYYYRGLSYLSLKRNVYGCQDLSRAGELGVEDAYEAIKTYCK